MKWIVLLCIAALAVVYVGFAAFGLVMSAFCFDAGESSAAWQCFTGINLAAVMPSLLFIIAGVVLFFLRRYKTALIVAAVPAAVAAIAYVVLFVSMALYRPSA